MNEFITRAINKGNRVLSDLAFMAGSYNLPPEGKRIIMYHGVDEIGYKEFNLRFVSIHDFEKQIAFYKRNFNVISIKDYFEKKFKKNKINIALTFDDGYENNFKYVLPVIEKYQVPVTFFVTGINKTNFNILWSDLIEIASTLIDKDIVVNDILFLKRNNKWHHYKNNKTLHQIIQEQGTTEYKLEVYKSFEEIFSMENKFSKYRDYWKLMSDSEIIQASKSPNITIGAHGIFHNDFGSLPVNEVQKELKESKLYLEKLTQKPCEILGYPNGSYSREVIDIAYDIGFKMQLAADSYNYPEDINDSRIEDRFGIYPVYTSTYVLRTIIKNINSL